MKKRIEIREVHTRPELDPYHADTLGMTYTQVELDPKDRAVWVYQEFRTNSMSSRLWYYQNLSYALRFHPDEEATREFLEGDTAQQMLDVVCQGHSVEWNGHNFVGQMTAEAEMTWSHLCDMLDELPESEWGAVACSDWLQLDDRVEALTGNETYEELKTLAAELERDSKIEKTILLDDPYQWLLRQRDALRDHQWMKEQREADNG